MKLYILEPQPSLSPRLGLRRDVHLVGGGALLSAVGSSARESDFILVSAKFHYADIFRFLREQPQLARQTVIVDIQEQPERILPFLEAGAAGYVRHGTSPTELISTLHEIRSGKPPLAPPVGDALLGRMHELLALQKERNTQMLPADCSALETLSERERQVLMLIRNGASNQEIANQLMIELGTVKNHVHNILKKLNVSRRAQAAQYVTLLEQII